MVKKIEKVLGIISAILLVILALIVTLQIFARVLTISVPWSEELARQALICLTFLGGALAYYRGGELKITLLIDIFPPALRKWNDLIISILSIAITIVVVFSGIKFLGDIWGSPTVALQLNKGIFFITIPTSFLLILIKLYKNLIGVVKPKEL
jgi:TRAP-type transport system small permease protein